LVSISEQDLINKNFDSVIIKISDFGLSKKLDNIFDPLKTLVGSEGHIAPEILEE
jgi:serine/threonine protein kinase